ncbi:MAG: bifunctional oligoribonuclease/PAP phosphatase NrnA, partial [Candidatus Omnitrophica bacterium]|nr:bifunctional oligoribonuclease/PAP phosphatase NrnA [Candidatus Omnitrophota bacterium]
IPDNLRFLPGIELVQKNLPEGFSPEVMVFLDCPVQERIGKVVRYLSDNMIVMNIDHHVSNEFFGDYNWVEPNASSAGEMVYNLIKRAGISVDDDTRMAIYAAIVTDTGMFNYDNTNSDTHRVVAEMIDDGIRPNYMYREIFEKKNMEDIKLLGMVLATLEMEDGGRIASVYLSREMIDNNVSEKFASDDFINFPRSIKGVEVAMFFNENTTKRGSVSVSFRSNGKVDVNKLASTFGGGGHRNASGCLMVCSLEEAKTRIVKEAMKFIAQAEGGSK